MKKQTYDLKDRLLENSLRIINTVEQLPNTRIDNHTSIKNYWKKTEIVIQSLTSLFENKLNCGVTRGGSACAA
jgi:hypothetical protein